MNRQLLKYSLGICIGITLVYLGYGIVDKIFSKKAIVARVSQLPAFEFRNLEGKKINDKSLTEKKPTWLLYFDSNCEFCQKEIEDIHQNIAQIDHLQLLLISSESTVHLQKINRKYGFNNSPLRIKQRF